MKRFLLRSTKKSGRIIGLKVERNPKVKKNSRSLIIVRKTGFTMN